MEGVKIVALCVASAIAYGIAHDNVTARVCVEYFTVFHPILVPTESPTVLALVWGVVATWWMGVLLGVPLAIVARAGSRPKLSARDLRRPIAILLGIMGCLSLLAGVVGYMTARTGAVWLVEPLASEIPRETQARFLADLWAHDAAYATGALGGVAIWIWAWRRRRAKERQER
jgi:hypothetical protein